MFRVPTERRRRRRWSWSCNGWLLFTGPGLVALRRHRSPMAHLEPARACCAEDGIPAQSAEPGPAERLAPARDAGALVVAADRRDRPGLTRRARGVAGRPSPRTAGAELPADAIADCRAETVRPRRSPIHFEEAHPGSSAEWRLPAHRGPAEDSVIGTAEPRVLSAVSVDAQLEVHALLCRPHSPAGAKTCGHGSTCGRADVRTCRRAETCGNVRTVRRCGRRCGGACGPCGVRNGQVTVRLTRYGHVPGPSGRWRCRRPAPVDVPGQGGRANRIGSLFDDACPTAVTLGYRSGRTLTWAAPPRRPPEPSRRCGVHRGMISSGIRVSS